MDSEDIRSILHASGIDIWTLIDTSLTVAALDHSSELINRRDGIIGKLYADVTPVCRNCNNADPASPGHVSTPISIGGDDDDEKTRILGIRDLIHDPNQSEDSVIDLLQTLADMDITFRGLQDTDIGRHVNRLRKHPSADVRRLVKILVRKWKDLVDEWVSSNTPHGELQPPAIIADGDSPQQYASRSPQNSHQQDPDFGYSPNPHNGNSSLDRNSSEPETKPRTAPARREPSVKPKASQSGSVLAPPPQHKHKEVAVDQDRLDSARKRLQENYQEAKNAKKQRTIQVMDIHEIPKPRNGFIARNKGGFHGRH